MQTIRYVPFPTARRSGKSSEMLRLVRGEISRVRPEQTVLCHPNLYDQLAAAGMPPGVKIQSNEHCPADSLYVVDDDVVWLGKDDSPIQVW